MKKVFSLPLYIAGGNPDAGCKGGGGGIYERFQTNKSRALSFIPCEAVPVRGKWTVY